MTQQVAIIDTGVANVRSLVTAFDRLGLEGLVTTDADVIRTASHVVLPGVGSFGAAIKCVDSQHLRVPIVERIRANQPTLAVCLGMQLLCDGSDESPGVPGLGIIATKAVRFSPSVTVPQLGWNLVRTTAQGPLTPGHAYFANSFRMVTAPAGWRVAHTDYDGSFISAVWRGEVLACQFHPELSGDWGEALLENWLRGETTEAIEPAAPTGLTRRIIPCLDVANGRVVKGVQFQNLRDAGDPAELGLRYQVQGADELVILDVTATREERGTMVETVERVRNEISIPLTVGGGVRSIEDAERLLRAGADKVSVNSAAVERAELVAELSAQFGAQCTVVAIDAKRVDDGWRVVTRGGTQLTDRDVLEWVEQVEWLGAGEILLTSHDRDGTGSGYDLELMREVHRCCHLPVIASGGARQASDLAAAFDAGAHAVLAASIFHDGVTTVDKVKATLADLGITVRR